MSDNVEFRRFGMSAYGETLFRSTDGVAVYISSGHRATGPSEPELMLPADVDPAPYVAAIRDRSSREPLRVRPYTYEEYLAAEPGTLTLDPHPLA